MRNPDLLLENKIKSFLDHHDSEAEETLESLIPSEDELEENADEIDEWQVGKKLKFDLSDLELEKWLLDLQSDKDALIDLLNNAKAVTPDRDAKLKKLKKIILDKVNNSKNISNKKVIVFTAFADTAKYLYENLCGWINTVYC